MRPGFKFIDNTCFVCGVGGGFGFQFKKDYITWLCLDCQKKLERKYKKDEQREVYRKIYYARKKKGVPLKQK